MLIKMAQSGQLRAKINEQQLINMLQTDEDKPKITFSRRRMDDSDDEDFGL
jgi:programmed cell death protein 5